MKINRNNQTIWKNPNKLLKIFKAYCIIGTTSGAGGFTATTNEEIGLLSKIDFEKEIAYVLDAFNTSPFIDCIPNSTQEMENFSKISKISSLM